MNASRLLEILNGGAVTPEWVWLALLAIYLSKESKRRGLRFFDWFRLPPSMNLILAVFIFDVAILVRSWVVWAWRHTGAGTDFNQAQTVAMVISGAFIVIGTLCKVRALTYPDYGNWPWLVVSAVTLVSVVGLVVI